MYQFTSRRKPGAFEALSDLEKKQLLKAIERLWGDELSEKEAASYEALGYHFVLWQVEHNASPCFELWTDGDPWMDGVLFEIGTTRLVPVALIQHRFTSLVQGFEELAAGLEAGERKLEPALQTNTNYLIRDVREEDAEGIVALLTPIIEAGQYTIMESISLEKQLEFIKNFPMRGVFLVAAHKDTGSIDGLQSIEPLTTKANQHIAEVSTFVSLALPRTKIGQSLSCVTFERAKEKGFAKIMATVRADNPRAIAFYQSQGFEAIGRAKKHAYLRGQYIDEIFLEKLF
jgi:L-amino acid N-acyltransferase YncA